MGKQQGCTAGLLATENILSGVPCQAKRPVDGTHLARKNTCAEAQLQRMGEKHGYPREQERYRQGIRFILTEHGNDACMYRQYNKVKMELQKNFLRNNDLGLLLLRLTVGGLMLFHGIAKAMGGYVFVAAMLAERGLPSGLVWLFGGRRAAVFADDCFGLVYPCCRRGDGRQYGCSRLYGACGSAVQHKRGHRRMGRRAAHAVFAGLGSACADGRRQICRYTQGHIELTW